MTITMPRTDDAARRVTGLPGVGEKGKGNLPTVDPDVGGSLVPNVPPSVDQLRDTAQVLTRLLGLTATRTRNRSGGD